MTDDKSKEEQETVALFMEIVADDDFDTDDIASEKRVFLQSLTEDINTQALEGIAQIERGEYEDIDDVIGDMERIIKGGGRR